MPNSIQVNVLSASNLNIIQEQTVLIAEIDSNSAPT